MNTWIDNFKNIAIDNDDLFKTYLEAKTNNGSAGDLFITRRQIFPGVGLKTTCEEWADRLKTTEENARVANDIWQAIVVLCLRTTGRHSSPESPVQKTARKIWPPKAFADDYENQKYAGEPLQENLFENDTYKVLHKDGAMSVLIATVQRLAEEAKNSPSPEIRLKQEQIAPAAFQVIVPGLGPKQSRYVLQFLGLTLYTIPIDSRVSEVINRDFPEIVVKNEYKKQQTSENSKHFDPTLSDLSSYLKVEQEIFNFCQSKGRPTALFDALAFSMSGRS